jgi:hypothetical protein
VSNSDNIGSFRNHEDLNFLEYTERMKSRTNVVGRNICAKIKNAQISLYYPVSNGIHNYILFQPQHVRDFQNLANNYLDKVKSCVKFGQY